MTTTAASNRIRRSVRFAQVEPRMQATSLRRERMTVSGRLENREWRNTQDWTGGLGISPSGRFQVLSEPSAKERIISGEGIRWGVAKAAIGLLAAVLVLALLIQAAAIGTTGAEIRKMDIRIEDIAGKNEGLKAQLTYSSGDVSVCTEAVKLNMISSNGAKAIDLTVPVGPNMMLVETGATGLRASAAEGGMTQGD